MTLCIFSGTIKTYVYNQFGGMVSEEKEFKFEEDSICVSTDLSSGYI